jgi:hypothetical protein
MVDKNMGHSNFIVPDPQNSFDRASQVIGHTLARFIGFAPG